MLVSVIHSRAAAAAAKSLQSCPILCDSIDGSPPGSAVPGLLQARKLEWAAITHNFFRKALSNNTILHYTKEKASTNLLLSKQNNSYQYSNVIRHQRFIINELKIQKVGLYILCIIIYFKNLH